MEEEKEVEEVPTRGTEWEVVTLTASTYAAAPGPEEGESSEVSKDEEERSHAMFMSGHFLFPPSQHENLPIEPNVEETPNEPVGGVPPNELPLEGEKENRSEKNEEENLDIEEMGVQDEKHGIKFFDDRDKSLPVHDTEFEASKALQGRHMVEEQNIYNASTFSSSEDEADISGSVVYDEKIVVPELSIPGQLNLDSSSDSPNSPSPTKKWNGSGLPCEAWWKRHAASLYAQAKEANALWSVFVAAALMGLVILGQRWQQERWHAQQIKWQLNLKDEKTNWMMGSISRFKDVLVGGNRRGSGIKGSASADH